MKYNDKIFSRLVSPPNPPYFIAEIGVNHNGKIKLAKKMILSAKNSKANAVKFQTFKAENLVSPQTPKVKYQKIGTAKKQSHYEMIRSFELTKKMHYQLYDFCKKQKIDFISTPYSIEDAKFLNKLGCRIFKTASADLVDLEMHEYLAKNKKIVLISVGMSTIKEIQECVKIYKKNKNNKFILLHCVSNYPCSLNSLNLNVLKSLKILFNCKVGFSDHSIGHEAAMLSYALGARVIEKHFTISRNLKGPDQSASSLPGDFLDMVDSVSKAHLILGNEKKECQKEEMEMLLISRKSLTLTKNLKKNTIMKKNFLKLKRPGTGLYYNKINHIIGKKTKKDLSKNYQPSLKDFK
jgi:N,N'-diacetyllegionaminate synthase